MTDAIVRYFAYGSNMSLAQTQRRLGRVPPRARAWLHDYALIFNQPMYDDERHAYANIVPSPGGCVPGVLYDCTESDMTRLDRVEGVAGGHYERQEVRVKADGIAVAATVYVGCAARVGAILPTTDDYLDSILEGARDNSFTGEEVGRILEAAGRSPR